MNKQLVGALMIIDLVHSAVKETGVNGIPSGHLYAMLMGYISVETYQIIINYLVQAKKITNVSHLLKSTELN